MNYYWLNIGPQWDFTKLEIGGTMEYEWGQINDDFAAIQKGDILICYHTNRGHKPQEAFVGLAKLCHKKDQEYIQIEKICEFEKPIYKKKHLNKFANSEEGRSIDFNSIFNKQGASKVALRRIDGDAKGKKRPAALVEIIKLENPTVDFDKPISSTIAPTEEASSSINDTYTKKDFLSKVYMTEENYTALTRLIRYKKNVILKGAPGVGKTFAARRLAYAMMGKKDEERVKLVQFHQSYSYEDFILGYKPDGDGYALTKGVFYSFCKKAEAEAEACPDKEFFFIIDEINRGNLSKIFGELMMLLEKDYRGEKATLAYSNEEFTVPKNLYIIGMMNTADRSLAMIDYALRRRFSFFEFAPGFETNGFETYKNELNSKKFNALVAQTIALNEEIKNDPTLGQGYCIGHSYFCGMTSKECTDDRLHDIVEYDLVPLLEEYWFDNPEKANKWANNLRQALTENAQ